MRNEIIELENGFRRITVYCDDNSIDEVYTVDKNGKRQGEAIRYHAPGGYTRIRSFYKDDLLDGPQEGYLRDTLLFRCHYVAGKKHGLYETFWDKYHLMSRRTFVDGLEEGPYEERYDNGRIRETGNFTKGELDGQVRRYSRDGKLIRMVEYKKGKKHGRCQEWNAYGELIKDCIYQNDEVVVDNLEQNETFKEQSTVVAKRKRSSNKSERLYDISMNSRNKKCEERGKKFFKKQKEKE